MVNDILNGIKSELVKYQENILEAENMGLRQLLQEIRNTEESFQYELYKIAQLKGYYGKSASANTKDIQNIKLELD